MNALTDLPNLEHLLSQYEAIGGIVEHVALLRGDLNSHDIETHRQAALRTIEILGQRLDRYFEDLLLHEEYKSYHREDFFRVQVHPELLSGREISLTEFLGPCFDFQKHRLIMKGRTSGHLNDYFYVGDSEIPRHVVTLPATASEFITDGYAQAFSEQPHGPHATPEEINTLFLSLSQICSSAASAVVCIFANGLPTGRTTLTTATNGGEAFCGQ